MSVTDARQRRRARLVTSGLLALLIGTAVAELELWPLTSFRLFSGVRTGTGVVHELVAVADDGARVVVPTHSHLVARLPQAPPDDAAALVGAWLDSAGIDPDDVDVVVLERATWQLDRASLVRRETGRDVVLEVRP